MKKCKTIIFDLGAVILNINYENTIDEFTKLGVKNAETFYSKKVQTELFNKIETGKISNNEFLKALQKETKNAKIKQVKIAWNAMLLDLPKERLQLIKKLKNNHTIYLLSNTNSIHINAFKEELGNKKWLEFCELFDKMYLSHELGLRKPDAKIFEYILNEQKLKAEDVFFIDDSPQHIASAKKLGINCHHLLDNEDITFLFPDIIL
jgi:HAD superfamily hydrolase (TIGR01509 family)|tara:strand:- start:301 stop:921 length:621 start_codon:yes stop_codon:yes gene_type:complete